MVALDTIDRPVITNACPPKRSQESLSPKLIPNWFMPSARQPRFQGSLYPSRGERSWERGWACVCRVMNAWGKFVEHERSGVRIAWGIAKVNFSKRGERYSIDLKLSSALQTSPKFQISWFKWNFFKWDDKAVLKPLLSKMHLDWRLVCCPLKQV